MKAASTSRPEDKVDLLRSASGKDGEAGLRTATRRIRLALLLQVRHVVCITPWCM